MADRDNDRRGTERSNRSRGRGNRRPSGNGGGDGGARHGDHGDEKDTRGARSSGSAEVTNWRRRGGERTANPPVSKAPVEDAKKSPPHQQNNAITAVLGLCDAMCSLEEVRMRQHTKEISRFEQQPPSEGSATGAASAAWAVKKYRRPAAGRIEINPKELRPPQVLLHTLHHLLTNVLPWSGCGFDWSTTTTPAGSNTTTGTTKPQEFLSLYHFVSDRMRSIRQDFVIQRVDGKARVDALVTIARFYILASFTATQVLPTTTTDTSLDWSETLNDQQLASALTEVHAQFQAMEQQPHEADAATELPIFVHEEIICYDILLHLQDPRAVSLLLLKVPFKHFSTTTHLRSVLRLFVAFQTRDLYQFMNQYRLLPVLQQCLALRHLPVLWTSAMTIMNKAYSKIEIIPLSHIAKWLDLPMAEDTQLLCTGLNVQVEDIEEHVAAAHPAAPVATSESWELSDGIILPTAVVPPVAIVDRSFVRFKVLPMHMELPKEIEMELLCRKATSIFHHQIIQRSSASELLLLVPKMGKN